MLDEFKRHIKNHLAEWLRNPGGSMKDEGGTGVDPIAPLDKNTGSNSEAYTSEEIIAKDETEVDFKAKDMIDQAWKLASEGHFVQAEVEFSKATVNQPGAYQLLNYSDF